MMKKIAKKPNFKIRSTNEKDEEWIKKFISKEWSSEKVISLGKIYYPHKLPGFVATSKKKILGLITYSIKKGICEIVTLNSVQKRRGIGTALLKKVKEVALTQGCKKLVCATSNDNIDALRFYQRKGFQIIEVKPNMISLYHRKMKKEIPLIGNYGIPIRDEIKLEMKLK
ncbi:MAG: GNAT family N-acetyltransferase [Candidatus Aenigmatarchaeota archaeon]